MLATLKGLSRHKRLPHDRREIDGQDKLGRLSAGRGAPHLFHDPLTVAARDAVRKASGRGTSFGRDVFAAPCGGVEQGTWGKKEAETICATCHLINMSTCLHIYVLAC